MTLRRAEIRFGRFAETGVGEREEKRWTERRAGKEKYRQCRNHLQSPLQRPFAETRGSESKPYKSVLKWYEFGMIRYNEAGCGSELLMAKEKSRQCRKICRNKKRLKGHYSKER